MKPFITALLASLFLAAPALADDTLPKDEQVCTSQFALCTSAPCIPDPSAPSKQALCTCEVTHGPNFADKTKCELRGPQKVATVSGLEVMQVISTYAFVQAATKPVMTCENTTPWTDCLNAVCIVDPKHPLKAICTCPYAETKDETYVTYGGSCNTNTCASAVWSAATVGAFKEGSGALMRYMNLSEKPWATCPGQPLN